MAHTKDLLRLVTCQECDGVLHLPRMLECTHMYCEQCVLSLKLTRVRDDMGYHCPQCGVFTNKDDVKESALMNSLVELHHSQKHLSDLDSTHLHVCGECGQRKSTWKCLHCKQEVCSSCKHSHDEKAPPILEQILSIEDDVSAGVAPAEPAMNARQSLQQRAGVSVNGISIDKALFCAQHYTKPYAWNCRTCGTLICDDCRSLTALHSNHTIETLEQALKRVVPLAQGLKSTLCSKVRNCESVIDKLHGKMRKLKAVIGMEKQQLTKAYEAYLTRFRRDYEQLVRDLDAVEQRKQDECQRLIEQLQADVTRHEHVIDWTSTSLAVAKNVSLLHELQAGLVPKIQAMAAERVNLPAPEEFDDVTVTFSPYQGQVNLDSIHNLLGEVRVAGLNNLPYPGPAVDKLNASIDSTSVYSDEPEYAQETAPGVVSEAADESNILHSLNPNSHEWSLPVSVLLRLKATRGYSQFQLDSEHSAHRFALIWGQLWIPVTSESSFSCIAVYNTDGKLVKTQPLYHVCREARALVQCAVDDVAIASRTGLFALNKVSGKLTELLNGNFSDVCLFQGQLYALDNDRNQVSVLVHRKRTWFSDKHIALERRHASVTDTLVVTQHHLFVASWSNYCVYKFNRRGSLRETLGRYGSELSGQLDNPVLCASDAHGSLLLCDKWNNRLQVLDARKQWSVVSLPGLCKPCYVVADVTRHGVWVLHGSRTLTFYRLQG